MMDDAQPILNKRKVLIILATFLVLLGVGTFALFYQGPSQEIPDSTEPMLNFAASGSKIAGIQVLVKIGGLSSDQYTTVYRELNQKLPEMEPDSRYFDYKEKSLNLSSSQPSNGEYDPDDEYVNEDVVYDILSFEMVSSSGTEYAVTVNMGEDLNGAKVTINKK